MRLALAALLALTLLRLALAAALPLAPDEAYYYAWSTHLQTGYYDHPLVVALLIRLGTTLFGPTALGIRFTGPLLAALGSVLVWDAGERLRPGAGLLAAALLNATLLIGVGCIIMTPDTPLMFFWMLGLWALIRLVLGNNPRWWLAVGVAAGAALASKYTGALFIVAVFGWLLASVQGRAALRTPWPWVAGALAVALFSPVLAWNAVHHWVSFAKQGGREGHLDFGWAAENFFELVTSQFALATPVIFVLAGAGLWHLRRDTSPAARLLLWLTLLPGAVFIEHVFAERVQGNWVAVLYPTICLAAALLPADMLARWRLRALASGFFITALTCAQALWGFIPLPANIDPTALQLAGWRNVALQAAALHPAFITSDDYWATSEIAYYAPADIPVYGDNIDKRWASFAWPKGGSVGDAGLVLVRRKEAACPDQIGTLTRTRGGHVLTTYRLCRFTLSAPLAVLPRPGADGH